MRPITSAQAPGYCAEPTGPERAVHREHLKEAIEHAAHLLPAQGPITVFIHHNTLHAFEDLPFDEAVKKGGKVFGCQPYLTEARYRDFLNRGRIRFPDLQTILEEDLGTRADEKILGLGTRLDLRLAMLQYPLKSGPTEELLWFVAETDALRRVRPEASSAVRGRLITETRRWVMRDLRGGNESVHGPAGRRPDWHAPNNLANLLGRFGESQIETWSDVDWEGFTLQALWRVCCEGARDVPAFTMPPPPPLRHRDLLLEATGADADALVNELLIRYCAAFLDQGFAPWPLPSRDQGIYRAFIALYGGTSAAPAAWLRGLAAELDRLDAAHLTPIESIHESLALLGVPESEWDEYIAQTLLALRGWAGMVRQVEERGDRVAHPILPGSLLGFFAIRLLLDRLALAHVAHADLGYDGPLSGLRDECYRQIVVPGPPSIEQRAFLVFQLAQVLGLSPDVLGRLGPGAWITLMEEIELFSGLERRRIFHLAYERRFLTQSLDALSLHDRTVHARPPRRQEPRYQLVCCLDEREESFRRHLEEQHPDVETFGAAGFYSVAIYYRGAADAHFVPLCPVVIRPRHWITEQVVESQEGTFRRRAQTRRVLGTASHRFHVGSRGFALGALLSAAVGALAAIPLVGRILFPRLAGQISQMCGQFVQVPRQTRLQLERHEAAPGPHNGAVGFTVEEMIDNAERLLRDMGLIDGFSRLLILLGHGSDSLNNPHNSAYNCGACGGAAGGPNARAMARILNDPRVRAGLATRAIVITDETWVVGGFHNTCDDSVTFHDVDALPDSHRLMFERARGDIDANRERNAHERCRRFMSAPLTLSFEDALHHVEERSQDLAQTRPELGHATNALCIVGRRFRTRGLYLDRRAFLTSYDPTQDDAEGTILARTLGAVFPVCAGINLEYFFSYVDNFGFGCGSKLPHNLSALLGVMDGAASDLRTGLPWQMVEIHEPVRLLFVIETSVETMLKIMARSPAIDRLVRNAWVQLALTEPSAPVLRLFKNGAFHEYEPQAAELPRAASSVDWYRGWRDHLEFAAIEA